MDKGVLKKILVDISPLTHITDGILLYGSQISGKADERSDIDICLIAGPSHDPMEVLSASWRYMDSDIYDIRVFEQFPLHLKVRVLVQGIWLYERDPPALGEYLYSTWKRWDDQRFYQDPIPGVPNYQEGYTT